MKLTIIDRVKCPQCGCKFESNKEHMKSAHTINAVDSMVVIKERMKLLAYFEIKYGIKDEELEKQTEELLRQYNNDR